MKGPTRHEFYACNGCEYVKSEYIVGEGWMEYHRTHPSFDKPVWIENPLKGISEKGCPILDFGG